MWRLMGVLSMNTFRCRSNTGVKCWSMVTCFIYWLYTIFILNCNYWLYADDLKLFRSVNSLMHCRKMQQDIDRIFHLSQNYLKFHIGKCAVMSFTRILDRNILHFSWKIGVGVLEVCSNKDLGILFNTSFHFLTIFCHYISQHTQCYDLLLGQVIFLNNITSIKLLYCSLVRSRVEFGSVVTDFCLSDRYCWKCKSEVFKIFIF